MMAPGVAQVIVTVRSEEYKPPGGLNCGVETAPMLIVYVATATAESVIPDLAANAMMIVVVPLPLTRIGEE